MLERFTRASNSERCSALRTQPSTLERSARRGTIPCGCSSRRTKPPTGRSTMTCSTTAFLVGMGRRKVAPGSGHWLSATYLFAFFALQAQSVLWWKSRTMPGYGRLNRKRAVVDSVLLAAFWIGISIALGVRGTLLAVVIPMLVANFVVLSYVITNHMLRPLS